MPKLLAIDYGSKRIGLAVADTTLRIAMPYKTVQGRNDVTRDARTISDLAQAESVDELIVGLPLNMNGSDSAQTEICRRFAAELARLSKKLVHLQDERLTSFAADEVLDEAEIPARERKDLRDKLAAQRILQAYLELMD